MLELRDTTKSDLERGKNNCYKCIVHPKGWPFEIVSDLGRGINYNKKGLKRLINSILMGEIVRLVITHKDILLRFRAELIFLYVK